MKRFFRNQKHFLMRLINLCLLVAVCVGYNNIAIVRAKKAAEIEKQNQAIKEAQSTYQDGTYEGSGTGFGGEIIVNVTIKKGSITEIEMKKADGEDSAYLDNAKKIIDNMIDSQSADVDVASGATYSSKGIIEAVKNALKEAS